MFRHMLEWRWWTGAIRPPQPLNGWLVHPAEFPISAAECRALLCTLPSSGLFFWPDTASGNGSRRCIVFVPSSSMAGKLHCHEGVSCAGWLCLHRQLVHFSLRGATPDGGKLSDVLLVETAGREVSYVGLTFP